MKEPHLKGKSWHAKLYLNSTEGVKRETDLPDNFCPYFWRLFWYIITLPFTCVGLLFISNDYDKYWLVNGVATIGSFVVMISCWVFGVITTGWLISVSWWAVIPHIIIGFLWLILAFLILETILFLWNWCWRWIPKNEYKHEDTEKKESSLIWVKWKAFKEKRCPMIHWDFKDED